MTVRAGKATPVETQVTEALNAFFKRNVKHKELNAIAEALKVGFIDVMAEMNTTMKALNLIEMNEMIYQDYDFFNDVSDRLLDKELAIKARRLEIHFFKKKNVYDKVPRSQAKGKKIIS